MRLLRVTRLQCYLNETLDHAIRNYITNIGVELLGEMGGRRCRKCEMQIFTVDSLFMIKFLKLVLFKRILEGICSVLHYKVLELIFCYTALQPGLSVCW